MRLLLILATCLAACVPCPAQELKPNPAIQDQINKVLNAPSPSAVQHEIEALKKKPAEEKAAIVEQLAFLAGQPVADERLELAPLWILHELDLAPHTAIRALAPHLDADNPRVREFALDWFQHHDNARPNASPLEPVNYKDYISYVAGKMIRNEEIPAGFAERLFQASPERALIVFIRAYQQRDVPAQLAEIKKQVEAARTQRQDPNVIIPQRPPVQRRQPDESLRSILLASHIVSDAIWFTRNGFNEEFQKVLPRANEQLAVLADHEHWWVRLYVAEIMQQHPELRQADIVQKFTSDANASVSKSAKSPALPRRVPLKRAP